MLFGYFVQQSLPGSGLIADRGGNAMFHQPGFVNGPDLAVPTMKWTPLVGQEEREIKI
jgi:hypothetical protein